MRTRTLMLCALLSLAALLSAQMPGPAEELGAFDPLLGNWEWTGKVILAEGAPELPWTGQSTITRILGGHFVQEDMRISFGEAMPAPMAFRAIYSWNAESKKYRRYVVGNSGAVSASDVYWHDGKLIGAELTVEGDGIPICDRWVVSPAGDKLDFVMTRGAAGGDFGEAVSAAGKRGGDGFDAEKQDLEALVAPVSEKMTALAGRLGPYTLVGEISPMPGMPMIPISAKEVTSSIFGGHIHCTRIHGDPVEGAPEAYEGRLLLGWDETSSIYRALDLGSFGEYTEFEVRESAPNQLIWTASTLAYGLHQIVRMVGTHDEKTRVLEMVGTRCAGEAKPDVHFKATSTPEKE